MNVRGLIQSKEAYRRWSSDICRENRRAIRLLWFALVPLGVGNLLARTVIAGPAVSTPHSALLLIYAILLGAVESFLLPADTKHATALLYLACAPVFALGVLLGTVWDPAHGATTILLLMMALPMFVLDSFLRVAGVTAFWLALFLLLSWITKTEALFCMDALHGVEFYFASLVVYALAMQVRLKYLQNMETVAFERDHDRETGCLNRKALESRLSGWSGSLVLLAVGLEQEQLYRDYFGAAAADAILAHFAKTLTDVFGGGSVYRCGETEFACLGGGEDAAPYLEKAERCRDALRTFRWEGEPISVGVAVGYASAPPELAGEGRDVLRLATINARKARHMGRNKTFGCAFSRSALTESIHRSTLLDEVNSPENDGVTGLPDLSCFVSHVETLLTNIVDRTQEPVVGYIKLHHMRDYNNRFGYEKGDVLLAETAELLRQAYPNRYLCHITGGKFCVLCYRSEAERGLMALREGQRQVVADMEIACRAGFAAYTGTESVISLLDRASSAYESISESKERVCRFYDIELDEELRFRDYIATHLDEAIESGWLKVYYQPIVRSTTGEICDEEALCRWDDPKYGMLPPFRFIPVLEERSLIYKMDLFIVRQVLREFDQRRELGVPIVPVSINLSRRDFEERDMVREIAALLDEAGCDRRLIKIEITESAFVTNQDLLKGELRRFHDAGFDIWMDDFGSEYSTLNLMQELDFDLIKIDMKFMENFTPDGRNYIIVSKIIDMARQLGVSTLIEGVETKEQLRLMQILGCEKIQGFYYNRPNPLSYIAQRVRNRVALPFEAPESTEYYETVGRVNLNEPMASGDGRKNLLAADIMPAGVVELRDGKTFCLRGTNAFLHQMERWGYLSAEDDVTRIRRLNDPPSRWYAAAEQCMKTEDWVSFSTKTASGRTVVVYVRRLGGVSWQGGTALLVVLLPEVKL